MHPELLFFGHKLSTYGLFLSLAHLAGIGAVLLVLKRNKLPLEPYIDLLFTVILATLAGARAGYIMEHHANFSSPTEWLSIWKGGLSLFAGLLAGFPVYLGMLYWRGLPVWKTSDLLVPILPFSLGLVRIGCFFAGCCHGNLTSLPWGIVPPPELLPPELLGDSIHPIQLYEAGFLFLLSPFLIWVGRSKLPAGGVVLSFLIAYSLFRLLINPLRGDLEPMNWAGISFPQAGAYALLLISCSVLLIRLRLVDPKGKSRGPDGASNN
jgi:phosphatidylglycerol:prolipoprotein diacylglycerol transferase